MPSRGKAAAHVGEWLAFAALGGVARILPRPLAALLGGALGRLAFDVVRLRRTVAITNVLERLAPAGGRREAVRIARASYAVIGRTFVDLVRLDRTSDRALWRLVSREEIERVRGALAATGRGVLVSGHFGNWELSALAIRRLGVPVRALAADQSNPRVDAFVKGSRGRAGIPTLSSRRGLREAVAALRANECIATLMDQDARRKGVFVDFLGTPTSTHTGVVSLAMRGDAPLVPGVLVDCGRSYRFVLGPVWQADPGLGEEENLRAGAEHFNRFLAEQVRRHPENYFWAHRRWKTRPPSEDGPR